MAYITETPDVFQISILFSPPEPLFENGTVNAAIHYTKNVDYQDAISGLITITSVVT